MHSACTRTCSRPTSVLSYRELHAAPAYAVGASPTPQRSCRSRRAADGPRFFSVLTFNSTAFGVAKRRLRCRWDAARGDASWALCRLPMTDNAQKLNPSSLSDCRFPSVHFCVVVQGVAVMFFCHQKPTITYYIYNNNLYIVIYYEALMWGVVCLLQKAYQWRDKKVY